MKRRKSIKNSSTSTDEDDVDESIIIEKIVAKARAIHEAKPANHLKDIEAAIKKNYRRSVVHRAVNPYVIASTPCGPPAGMALSQNISSISSASNEIGDYNPKIDGAVGDLVDNLFRESKINHELSQNITRSKVLTHEYAPDIQENVQCSNHEKKNTSINKQNSHHSLRNISKNSGSKLQSVPNEDDSDSSVFIENEPSKKKEKIDTIPEVKLNGNSSRLNGENKENSHYAQNGKLCDTRNPEIKPPNTIHEDTISSSSSYNFRVRTANAKIVRNGEQKQNNRRNKLYLKNNYNSDDSSDQQNTKKPHMKSNKNGEFKTRRPSKYSHRRNESCSSGEEGTTRRRASRHYSRSGRNRESKRKTIRSSVSRKTYHHKHKRHPSRERYYSKSGRRKHYSSSSHSTSTYTDSDDDEKTITKSRRMSRVEKYEQDLKYGRRRKSCNSKKSSQRNRDTSDEGSKRRRRPSPEKPDKSQAKPPDSETLTKVVGMLAAQLLKIQKDDNPLCSNEQSTAVLGCCSKTHTNIRSAHEKIRSAFDWNKFLCNNDNKKNWLHKYEGLPGESFELAHIDEWSQGAARKSPTKVRVLRQLARKPFRDVDPRIRAKLHETKISECSVEDDGSVQVFHKSRNQSRRKTSKLKRNLNEIVTKLTTFTTKSRKRKALNHLLKTDKSNKAILDEILGYLPQQQKKIPNKHVAEIKDQGTSPFIVEPQIEFSPRRKVLHEIVNESNCYKSSPLFGWGTTRDTLNDEDLDTTNRSALNIVTTPKTTQISRLQIPKSEQKRTSRIIGKAMLNRSIQTSRELIKDETLKPESIINKNNKSTRIDLSTSDCVILNDKEDKPTQRSISKLNIDHNRSSRIQKILQLSRKRLSFHSTSVEGGSTESEKNERKPQQNNIQVLNNGDISTSRENRAESLESECREIQHVVSTDLTNEDVLQKESIDKKNISSKKDYGRKSSKINNNRPSNPVNVSLGSAVEFRTRRTRSSTRNTQGKYATNLNEENLQSSITERKNNKVFILQNVTVARKKRSNVDNNMNMNISYVAPEIETIDSQNTKPYSQARITRGMKKLDKDLDVELDVSKENEPESSIGETENLHQESCIVSTPKLKNKSGRKMEDEIFPFTGENEESRPFSSPSKRSSSKRKNEEDKSVIDPEFSNREISPVTRSTVQEESGKRIQDWIENIGENALALGTRKKSRGKKTLDAENLEPEFLNPESCSVSTLSREKVKKIQDGIEEIEENRPLKKSKGRKTQDAENLELQYLSPNSRSTLSNENVKEIQDGIEEIEEKRPRKKSRGRKTQDAENLEPEFLNPESSLFSSSTSTNENVKKIQDGIEEIEENRLRKTSRGRKTQDADNLEPEFLKPESCPVSRSTLTNENVKKIQDDIEEIEANRPRRTRRGGKTQDDEHSMAGSNEDEGLNPETYPVLGTKDESAKKPLNGKTCMEENSLLSNSKLKNRRNGKIKDNKRSNDDNWAEEIPNQETCPDPSPNLRKRTERKADDSVDQKLGTEKSKTTRGKRKPKENISVAIRASTRERRPPRACWWKKTVTERDCEIYGNMFAPTVSSSTTENGRKSLKNKKTKKTKEEPKSRTKNITKKTAPKVVPEKNLEPSTSVARISMNVNQMIEAHPIVDANSEAVKHDVNSSDKQIWESISEKVNNLCVGSSSSFSGNKIFNTNVEHGILRLAPMEERRSINIHNTVIYYVLKGTFSLKIGHTYSETPPMLFVIPKGKRYVFHNKKKKPVLLAYVIDES